MALLPVLFGMPVVLLPAHIAFLELIIDPACSTVFEGVAEDRAVMKRPPRNLREPLLGRREVFISLFQGLSVLAGVMAVFVFELYTHAGALQASTLAFVTLVFANLMLIITNVSWTQNSIMALKSKNIALLAVGIVTIAALTVIIASPFLRSLFHFSAMSARQVLIALTVGIASLIWFEGVKVVLRNSRGGPGSAVKHAGMAA
jgi:P-type Ca2+ transporter type 2C